MNTSPPKDGGVLTISGNLKSFEGPVLNCRGGTHRVFWLERIERVCQRRAWYLNELVIH
jgi:hypothetical protein